MEWLGRFHRLSSPREFCVIILAIFLVGCETWPTKIERDELYPPDWPDAVGSGTDCRGIEGTFENRGSLVERRQYDSSGRLVSAELRIRDVLLSEMFNETRGARDRSLLGPELAGQVALGSYSRVSLSVEPYSQPISSVFDWKLDRLMLVIAGTPAVDSSATVRVGHNECSNGIFVNRVQTTAWAVEVGSDGNLLVDRRILIGCWGVGCDYDRVLGRFPRVR